MTKQPHVPPVAAPEDRDDVHADDPEAAAVTKQLSVQPVAMPETVVGEKALPRDQRERLFTEA